MNFSYPRTIRFTSGSKNGLCYKWNSATNKYHVAVSFSSNLAQENLKKESLPKSLLVEDILGDKTWVLVG